MGVSSFTPTVQAGRPTQANDVGTTATGGITVDEFGVGPVRMTRLTFNNVTFNTTYSSATNTNGGVSVYTMPRGLVAIRGATCRISGTVSGSVAVASAFSVGSVVAANDNALSSTEADIIPSTAFTPTAGVIATTQARSSSAPGLYNGQSTPQQIFFNLASGADYGAARTVTLNGWIIIGWELLGDTSVS